jgi:uncharacterized protein HemX
MEHKEDLDLADKLTQFENKHRAFLNLLVKPFGTLLIFLAIGYYTMWMSTHYVSQEKFLAFIDKQDKIVTTNFETTRAQLQTIINQQTMFAEQLKAYNNQFASHQKSLDDLNDRILYLERKDSKY